MCRSSAAKQLLLLLRAEKVDVATDEIEAIGGNAALPEQPVFGLPPPHGHKIVRWP